MRRLFFTFAGGAPGIGLLIMRVTAGVGLCAYGATGIPGAWSVDARLFGSKRLKISDKDS